MRLTAQRCGVVTGANKGIGLEICRQLASHGISVILTARDEQKGIEAVDSPENPGSPMWFFSNLMLKIPPLLPDWLDLSKPVSVNNAGVGGLILNCEAFREFKLRGHRVSDENAHLLKGVMDQTYEKARECVDTNYYGTKMVTEALIPLMELSQSARIVNLTSFHGQLKFIGNGKVKADLENIENLTDVKLDEILEWFLRDFMENKLQDNGWPVTVSAYKVSKAAVNAYTRIMANKYLNMKVNCVHPGLVKTDMTCNMGNLTAEEGARAPVMLALTEENSPSGFYFDEMNVSSF